MLRFCVFVYFIAPLIVVPYIAYKQDNWYILFGIAFCYIGVYAGKAMPSVFYLILCLCIGFWFKAGFDIHQYITLFFFCMLGGFFFSTLADEYEKLVTKQDGKFTKEMKGSNELRQQIAQKILKYKEDNPKKDITPAVQYKLTKEILYDQAKKDLKGFKKF